MSEGVGEITSVNIGLGDGLEVGLSIMVGVWVKDGNIVGISVGKIVAVTVA